jgi:hypothetical protein
MDTHGEHGDTILIPGAEEEDLEKFMWTHGEILEGADSVRELRRAGGELVQAFRRDAHRLAAELLSFCRLFEIHAHPSQASIQK